jgi:hypothetical protein
MTEMDKPTVKRRRSFGFRLMILASVFFAAVIGETVVELHSKRNRPTYVPPEDAFTVTLPDDPRWKVIQRGPLPGVPGSYALLVADISRVFQLSAMMMPAAKDSPTLEAGKSELEAGWLEKGKRKKSGEMIKLNGRDGYKLVAEFDTTPGGTFETTAIFFVEYGRSFIVSAVKPANRPLLDPEADQFINSFKITDSKTYKPH